MALTPKPPSKEFILVTEGGLALVSADLTPTPATILLTTEEGLAQLTISATVERSLILTTGSGLSTLTMEFLEEEDVPWRGFRLDWSTAELTKESAHLTASYGVTLEVFYAHGTLAWDTEVLIAKTPALSASWQFGVLSQMVRPLDFAYDPYVVTEKYREVATSYEVRSWDAVVAGLTFDMGVNTLVNEQVSIFTDMGVLSQRFPVTIFPASMGVNHPATILWGAEYAAGRYNPPVFSQWDLRYHVHSFEGTGYEVSDFTLSWEQQAQADRRDFNLGYSQTYMAQPVLGISYERHFSVGIKVFTLSAYKERHLLHGLLVAAPFGVMGGVDIVYSLNEKLTQGVVVSQPLNPLVYLGTEVALSLSMLLAGVEVGSPINRTVALGLEVPMPSTTSLLGGVVLGSPLLDSVMLGLEVVYDLKGYTPVIVPMLLSMPLVVTSSVVVNTPFTLEDPTGVDADGLDLISASVVADEGNFGWVGTFELEHIHDLNKFVANSIFSFTIGTDEYVFMVESKSLNRTAPAQVQPLLKAISPAVQLTAPRAKLMSKTWAEPIMSHDLIREVAGGYPLELSILNWPIPANRFGVSLQSPMEVIRQVAAAVGGVVDSLPNGVLRVRPKFPVPVPQWGPDTVDHQYVEEEDIFTSNEDDVPVRVFDKFRVMDTQAFSGLDRLEFEEIDSTRGKVRAYPSPYRTNVILFSSHPEASSGPHVEEYRDEEETVEIYNGEGSVRFPVTSVNSIQWEGTNLLGVVAGNDSTKITATHPTEKFSLLKISYKTRCLVFPVSGPVDKKAQFLLRNP